MSADIYGLLGYGLIIVVSVPRRDRRVRRPGVELSGFPEETVFQYPVGLGESADTALMSCTPAQRTVSVPRRVRRVRRLNPIAAMEHDFEFQSPVGIGVSADVSNDNVFREYPLVSVPRRDRRVRRRTLHAHFKSCT